jgi:formylglycine-generating enzyme required for sulfatase activity
MDCGGADGGVGPSDCCGSFGVKGGSFDRSYDGVSTGIATNPNYTATVNDFRLDAYEVTVGRFRAFVSAGYMPPAGSGKHAYLSGGAGLTNVGGGDAGASEPGWSTSWDANLETSAADWNTALSGASCPGTMWTNAAAGNEHRPINCVTWYEAYAFCIWDGGFLPSEAEWNYAAAGGSQQRAYPWSGLTDAGTTSTAIDCGHANYNKPCSPAPNDVGSQSPLGDGRFGQADLAGNVSEWTLDSFAAYVTPCVDCSNVAPLGSPVQRGGSYNGVALSVLASYRASGSPSTRDGSVGFRCARAP